MKNFLFLVNIGQTRIPNADFQGKQDLFNLKSDGIDSSIPHYLGLVFCLIKPNKYEEVLGEIHKCILYFIGKTIITEIILNSQIGPLPKIMALHNFLSIIVLINAFPLSIPLLFS